MIRGLITSLTLASPATGDSFSPVTIIVVAVLAVAALIATAVIGNKKNKD